MAAKRVAVVGAGIAGLGAAWRLAQRGFQVSLFEREQLPGGRARPVVRENFTIERAGAIVGTADKALLSWIGELDLPELLPLRPVVRALAHRDRVQVIDPRSLLGIARIPGVRIHQLLGLLRLPRLVARYGNRIDPERPERAASLDDRSLADFGRLYFGARVTQHWMGPLVSRTSLADAREVSRVLFLHHYRDGAGERLGLLRSSSQELMDRAASSVPAALGVCVANVESCSGGGVRFRVRGAERERLAEADAIVLAVPAPEAVALAGAEFSFAERDALEKVRYTPEISLAVALRRPFHSHPQQIQFPQREGWPLESVLLEPGFEGGRVPKGRGLALLRATGRWSADYFEAPDETVGKELIAALSGIFPRIHGAGIFAEVLREKRAVPRFDVGRYRAIADFTRVQADCRRRGRRIYFAGDYLMGPGWNAALRSGYRAAADVAVDLG
ncbi:MAG: FAD-dependent oxidoreductase [Deltaproteobacteria bacterium]|nr:FAD-dependent oxidoreductase [Deltaproteobacteria bacterium]MBW2578097.1 FAD-dependent oxidoreductase [Deltaproteobacteria bacterium]